MLLTLDQMKRRAKKHQVKSGCRDCQVLDISNRIEAMKLFPEWFVQLIPSFGRVVYSEDVSKDFEICEDPHRFAEGWGFICKHCGCVATQRYDYAEESRTWLLVKIRCRVGCGRRWEAEEIEPIWVRILEDWIEE